MPDPHAHDVAAKDRKTREIALKKKKKKQPAYNLPKPGWSEKIKKPELVRMPLHHSSSDYLEVMPVPFLSMALLTFCRLTLFLCMHTGSNVGKSR
jgi:hypothetical protein